MPATLPEAVEQMQELFYAAWVANAGAIFGYLPGVEWYGKPEYLNKVDRSKVWVRYSSDNVIEAQATLSTCLDEPNVRRYEGSGLIFVQLFIPKTIDNGVILGRQLAKVARDAFRGKKTEGGVTFHNCRINDNLTPEELFYRMNVVVEYDYDELG